MYKVLHVEDKIRVPPIKFNLALNDAVKSSLEDRWESVTDKRLGVVLGIVSIENVGEGKILPGDGAVHYPVTFNMAVYQPELHEVVKGEIIDVTEFGAFIRMGPIDGMIHVSQIMSDFVSYDSKGEVFSGKESNRKLKKGDTMVARIISVSMERNQYKIGLTARQAGLGTPEWIDADKKNVKRAATRSESKPAERPKPKPKGKK